MVVCLVAGKQQAFGRHGAHQKAGVVCRPSGEGAAEQAGTEWIAASLCGDRGLNLGHRNQFQAVLAAIVGGDLPEDVATFLVRPEAVLQRATG